CCLLTEGEDSSCQCLADGTNCDAEAASRRDTTVVSACPPGAESLPVACAEVAENCELAYLQQQGFEDCCDGSVCDLGANGIRICRVATDEEVRRARECRRAAYSGTDNVVFEPVAIATSVGTLTFTDLFTAQGLVGPGGCINGASMRLSDGGLCSLELTAGLVDGALAVTSVDANLHNCSGYEGSEAFLYIDEVDPANIPFAVSIDAISCDWGGGFEGYCTSGEITWTLQGTLAGITFEAMSIPLTGVTCVAQPAGDCPP